MKKAILSTMLMLFVSVAAMAKGDSTVVFTTTPQMHCANCETKIKGNLRFEKGVKDIATSVPDQTVTVTYDPKKTNVDKLLKGFTKFGYTARRVQPGEKVATKTDEACPNMY